MAPQQSTIPPILSRLAALYQSLIHPYLPSPIQVVINNITPFTNDLISSATNGNLTSLLSTLLILYMTLRVANYIRRSIFAWVAFVVKIVLVLALINVAVYVNRVGAVKAAQDAEWILRIVWDFVEERVCNATAAAAGSENNTGYFGGAGSQWNLNGGKQQVPVGKDSTKRKSGGWT